MKKIYIVILLAGTAIVCGFSFKRMRNKVVKIASPADQTLAIVKATSSFLKLLSLEQRAKISFAFTPQKAATAAKFARTGNQPGGPGGPPPGGGNKQGPPPGNMPPRNGPPGGGGSPGRGQFPGLSVSNMARRSGQIIRLVMCRGLVCSSAA